MKKRWEDDDEFQDENLFPDIDGDEDYDDEEDDLNLGYLKILEKREDIEIEKLRLMQKQLNFDILAKSLAYLEKSWFWGLKSKKKKLDLLIETYQLFKTCIDIDNLSSESKNAELPI